MLKTLIRVLVAVLCCALPATYAEVPTPSEVRSLDDQVQQVKSDVLEIASELGTLEEQLLFPSSTQVSVFVALLDNETLRLDAVEVRINDALKTHHIYNFKELDALRRGGVQRLLVGNLNRGDHRLEVTVIGKIGGKTDYEHTQTFTFTKDIDPRVLGIAVAGPAGGTDAISLSQL